MTTRTPYRVAAIGSCRVFTPLGILSRAHKIQPVYETTPWYTHSTRDALQKYAIVNGNLNLTSEEISLIVHGVDKYKPSEFRSGFYDAADIAVVEIASIKSILWRHLEIQQWCLRDLLLAHDVQPEPIYRMLRLPVEQRDVSVLPPSLRAIGAEAIHVSQTDDQVAAELRQLQTLLRCPLVLVPPINVEGAQGTLLPERQRLSTTLAAVAPQIGAQFFDPAVHIREYGVVDALKDLGHYQPAFEKVLADKLLAAIESRLGATDH